MVTSMGSQAALPI
jgi:hypothetical protein